MNLAKSEILTAAIASQQIVINDLEKRLKDIMANDGNVNEEEYDSTEQSIKSALIEEAEMVSNELTFVKNELQVLEKLKNLKDRCTTAQPGAVVTTNHGIFFISASIENFNVGTARLFGISVDSPIYKKMQGKGTGDKFYLKNKDYIIQHIY